MLKKHKILINEYNITTKKIESLNITLLSDIHYYDKRDINKLNQITHNLKKIKSDYICIAGDLIEESIVSDLEYLYKWLKEISKISKVIISLGNHDIYIKQSREYYKNEEFIYSIKNIDNVILLDDEIYIENNICFIGITNSIDYYKHKDNEKFNFFAEEFKTKEIKLNKSKYNILLCHSPISIINKDIIKECSALKNIDLILCGHMHAGLTPRILQKVLKHRVLVSPGMKMFVKDAYGHIKRNNIDYIISAGITKASHYNPIHFMDNLFYREIVSININKKC